MIFGAIVVALISIAVAIATWKIRSFVIRLILVTICAFTSAYLAYWIPAKLIGSNDPQYSTWERLVVDTWFTVGLVAGCIALMITLFIKNRGKHVR